MEGTDPEQLMKKHQEYRLQMDKHLSKSQLVKEDGRSLIRKGTFRSQQVRPNGFLSGFLRSDQLPPVPSG